MKIKNLLFNKNNLTLVGIVHSQESEIVQLQNLLYKSKYHRVFLELCPQRFRYIQHDLLESNNPKLTSWNEFYLAIGLQKSQKYSISLIDASTSDLVRALKEANQKSGKQAHPRKKGNFSTLQEDCYYTSQFYLNYNLCLRIKGNMLAKYPGYFQDFYQVFVKDREEIMKVKIKEELMRSNPETQENIMILIGQYHFDRIYNFLGSMEIITKSN